jgi:purine/pyrimidine-nucleoside phosphorylase
MDIVAGSCLVTLDGSPDPKEFIAGSSFDVPGKSGFTIVVATGITEYVCSFG